VPALVDEGPYTDKLVDDLQVRLGDRAIVGRRPLHEVIPVYFFDNLGGAARSGGRHRSTHRRVGRTAGAGVAVAPGDQR
jgi:hypothetical protein